MTVHVGSRRSAPSLRTVSRSWSIPREMKHRGVEVVGGRFVGRGLPTPRVAFAIGDARLDARTAHPAGEYAAVVVAPFAALRKRHPAKFGVPEHERVVEAGRAASGRRAIRRSACRSPRTSAAIPFECWRDCPNCWLARRHRSRPGRTARRVRSSAGPSRQRRPKSSVAASSRP